MRKKKKSPIDVKKTSPMIFATGVFLKPLKLQVGDQAVWHWVAHSFEDDSFYNGELCNPANSSLDSKKFLRFFDD
jgi:hypothetical protein